MKTSIYCTFVSSVCLMLVGIMATGFVGCSQDMTVDNVPDSAEQSIESMTTPVAVKSNSSFQEPQQPSIPSLPAVQDKTEKALEVADGVLGKASDLFNKAKKAAPTIDGTKQWLGERLTDASDMTGKTADETSKWIADTYKSLKDSGMTSAENAQEWLAEDWKNIGAWDYKVVTVSKTQDDGAVLEKKLNEFGNERWECFNITQTNSATTMFFKRSRDSYLKHVPLRDVLHLIPFVKAIDSANAGE